MRICLVWGAILSGKRILNSTIKSPRWLGALGKGSPSPRSLFTVPGLMMSLQGSGITLPSMVGMFTVQPHRACGDKKGRHTISRPCNRTTRVLSLPPYAAESPSLLLPTAPPMTNNKRPKFSPSPPDWGAGMGIGAAENPAELIGCLCGPSAVAVRSPGLSIAQPRGTWHGTATRHGTTLSWKLGPLDGLWHCAAAPQLFLHLGSPRRKRQRGRTQKRRRGEGDPSGPRIPATERVLSFSIPPWQSQEVI